MDSNKTVRSGWGNRKNFEMSYGLKAGDFQGGKEILKAIEKLEKKSEKQSASKKEANGECVSAGVRTSKGLRRSTNQYAIVVFVI